MKKMDSLNFSQLSILKEELSEQENDNSAEIFNCNPKFYQNDAPKMDIQPIKALTV
jgi:hypothetical protein